MAPRRTEFEAFVLDLMDFIEEKIHEAMANEPSRAAAIGEAAGAIPVLRDRLRENEPVQANFILVLGNVIEQRWASGWWGWPRQDGAGRVRTDRTRSRRAAGHPSYAGDGGRRVVARQTEACRFAAQHSGTTFSGSN